MSAFIFGDPTGNRTPVLAVRGLRPRPLDDRAVCFQRTYYIAKKWFCQ